MSPQKRIQKRKMGGEQPDGRRFLLCLVVSLLLQGRANAFTMNCSGFERHGVDPAIFQAVFDRKAFRPVTNQSYPTHVNISFTLSAILQVDPQLQLMTSFLWIDLTWNNPFISWDPEECIGIKELSVSAEQMWLPDIFILESMNVSLTPSGFTTFVTSEGQIKYSMPMRVTSICNLDIFYFPFDQQNCTLTFCSFLYTVDSMLLGMDKEVWEITNLSRKVIWTRGEWELLSINKATPKLFVGKNLYDQIMFYVAIRRRPTLYVINLLVPSGLLVAIDAFSFYLPAESQNRAPFKITLLLGYNVFLLMMNDLLPATGTPLISVYFALCLSLMVVSLLETVFITYLLHLATTQPPPMPWWLHSLMLRYTRKSCPATAPQDNNKSLGHSTTHLPGLKEPVELVAKGPGLVVAEVHGCPKQPRCRQEHETPQQQQLVELWVQFSHLMDTLLFRLYLLFMACSIITIIILWST